MNGELNGKSPESVAQVHGYCVHCRSQRPMQGAIQVCNRRGGRDLKGHCAVCGKSMYRLGGWDSVAAAAQKAALAETAMEVESSSAAETPSLRGEMMAP
jgi:hypothetical protein